MPDIDNIEQITISKERYIELLEATWKLDALEIIGVESWDGFDDAVKLFNHMKNTKSEITKNYGLKL